MDGCVCENDSLGGSICIKNGIWRWSWVKDIWDYFGWAFLQDAMLYSLGHHGLVHWMNDGWTTERRLYLPRQMGGLN
jgi:hypothetical protein